MNGEFEELDRLENTDEPNMQAWLCEFWRIYMRRPIKDRASTLINAFLNNDNPSEKEYDEFISWLVSGPDAKVKEEVLDGILDERTYSV